MRQSSRLVSQVSTIVWHLRRPQNYAYLRELFVRRLLRPDFDTPSHRDAAVEWAAERAVQPQDALSRLGLPGAENALPRIPAELLEEAEQHAQRAAAGVQSIRDAQLARDLFERRFLRPNLDKVILGPEESNREATEYAARYSIAMGGAADITLLYAAVKLSGAVRVIETGVAFGWSSLAVLAALEGRKQARLVSVDMPHAKLSNDRFVGIVVPPPSARIVGVGPRTGSART